MEVNESDVCVGIYFSLLDENRRPSGLGQKFSGDRATQLNLSLRSFPVHRTGRANGPQPHSLQAFKINHVNHVLTNVFPLYSHIPKIGRD